MSDAGGSSSIAVTLRGSCQRTALCQYVDSIKKTIIADISANRNKVNLQPSIAGIPIILSLVFGFSPTAAPTFLHFCFSTGQIFTCRGTRRATRVSRTCASPPTWSGCLISFCTTGGFPSLVPFPAQETHSVGLTKFSRFVKPSKLPVLLRTRQFWMSS